MNLTPSTINIHNFLEVNSSMTQYNLVFAGIIANKVDAAPPNTIVASGNASIVQATVNLPPLGNDILMQIYQSGTLWASLDLVVGTKTVVLGSITVAGLAAVVAGNNWTLNVTQVGGTFPGQDLVVSIVV